jgi:hypothetical protein
MATVAMGGAAQAATTYFVSPTGDNSTCLSAATACQTLSGAVGVASDGDTINVAPGSYTNFVTVTENDLTIVGADPATTIIDSNGPDAIYVNGAGDGASLDISGITLRAPLAGANRALSLNNGASVTASQIRLRGGSIGGAAVDMQTLGANSIDIDDSEFIGAGPSAEDLGVISFGLANTVKISNSTLSGYSLVLQTSGSVTTLLGNEIGITDFANSFPSTAMGIAGGTTTLKDNTVTHAGPTDPGSIGIAIGGGTLDMARNKLVGLTNRTALYIDGPTTAASLFSDVLAGNAAGLVTVGGGTLGATLTNVTITGNTELNLSATSTTLGLDSTLIGDAGSSPDILNGTTTCIGSNSRVPPVAPWDSSGCTGAAFTNVDPLLGGTGGWHLQSGSPMIDAGGLALVDSGNQTDADGDARHIAGPLAAFSACAAPTRDIGADEFTPGRDCTPPTVPGGGVPPVPIPKPLVKCKKPKQKTKRALKKFKKCKKRLKKKKK